MVRYPWYAASLAGGAPNALTWARYSAFLPLYPIGVVSEMWLIYKGLPAVRQRQLHSVSLPHPWNFAFDYSYFLMVSCFLVGGVLLPHVRDSTEIHRNSPKLYRKLTKLERSPGTSPSTLGTS